MAGWLKLSREINTHWIWNDPIKFKWWIDILLTVNFEDKKVLIGNTLMDCNRGQSLLSLSSWGARWGVNKKTVDSFFKLLKKDGMILTENGTVTTRLTVCNYDTYQQAENAKGTQRLRVGNALVTQEKRDLVTTKEGKEREELKERKEGKGEVFRSFAHLSIFKSEYDSLATIYTSQKVDSILDSIQNYSKNTAYKSLYITAKKWLEKDAELKPQQGTIAKTPHRYKPL